MSKNKKQSEESLGKIGSALGKSEAYIEKNSKQLITILLIIAIVVAGVFAIQKYYFAPREQKAEAEIFMAQQDFMSNNFESALTGDGNYLGFLDIKSKFGGTRIAKTTNYYIGICYLHLKDFDKAIGYLKKFKSKDYYYYALSKSAIGDCYTELGNLNEAIKYYSKAANLNKNNNTTPEYLKKLAIAYELNSNYKAALNTYNKILAEYPNSPLKTEVRRSIGRLENIQ